MMQDWQKPLRSPEREIRRYAEYVKPSDLEAGQVYFRLSYLDDAMRVPELVPLVFISRELDPENGGIYRSCFQDAGSYFAGVRLGDDPQPIQSETEEERLERWLERGHFETFAEAGGGVLTFEKAFDLLLLCSLERNTCGGARPPNLAVERTSASSSASILARVARLAEAAHLETLGRPEVNIDASVTFDGPCLFCGKMIDPSPVDPCRVRVETSVGLWQMWFCHAACFKSQVIESPYMDLSPAHF